MPEPESYTKHRPIRIAGRAWGCASVLWSARAGAAHWCVTLCAGGCASPVPSSPNGHHDASSLIAAPFFH